MQETQTGLTADLIVQYSIVGAILLAIFGWMIWKIVKMNKKKAETGSCCNCGLADTCKKKSIKNNNHGNNKNI